MTANSDSSAPQLGPSTTASTPSLRNLDDTIAAISTTVAPSARIIIRLSGPQSLQIAQHFSNHAHFAHASAQQFMLSFSNLQCPAWIYAFQSPHSYTGEDSVEFHLPGSPVLARMFLNALYRQGARPAEPGEFTARAFFNGKLGLSQAEGVAAIIAAGNNAELLAARQLLAGELSCRLLPITDHLAQTLALIEINIDFSEEDVAFIAGDEVARRIASAQADLQKLVDQSVRFEQLTHQPRIVLAGRPNAGKSSLINALCGQDRAVVADVSGTTRDVLTARVNLKRGQVILSDIAGVEPVQIGDDRQTHIDQQMQQRARQAIESADHVVLVIDSADTRSHLQLQREPSLIVHTKADLKIAPLAQAGLRVSSLTGQGIIDLLQALHSIAFGKGSERATLALNQRHLSLIDQAQVAMSRGALRCAEGAAELVAIDLRDALDALGSIIGQVSPDDVLGRIFSAFCIGK